MSKNIKSVSNPMLKLEILTKEEVKKIHEATLWIIEHVGIRFPSPRALEIWEANGATVDPEKSFNPVSAFTFTHSYNGCDQLVRVLARRDHDNDVWAGSMPNRHERDLRNRDAPRSGLCSS